jgi:hypothetical protein
MHLLVFVIILSFCYDFRVQNKPQFKTNPRNEEQQNISVPITLRFIRGKISLLYTEPDAQQQRKADVLSLLTYSLLLSLNSTSFNYLESRQDFHT